MRVTLVSLAVAGLLAAGCSSEPKSAEELCPDPVPGDRVEMADFSYSPICVAVDEGETLEIPNTGAAPHTFTVEGTEIDVNVDAGGSATVDLVGVAPGTYGVTCTLHPQMRGALQVA